MRRLIKISFKSSGRQIEREFLKAPPFVAQHGCGESLPPPPIPSPPPPPPHSTSPALSLPPSILSVCLSLGVIHFPAFQARLPRHHPHLIAGVQVRIFFSGSRQLCRPSDPWTGGKLSFPVNLWHSLVFLTRLGQTTKSPCDMLIFQNSVFYRLISFCFMFCLFVLQQTASVFPLVGPPAGRTAALIKTCCKPGQPLCTPLLILAAAIM